jgi:hypothetical protein
LSNQTQQPGSALQALAQAPALARFNLTSAKALLFAQLLTTEDVTTYCDGTTLRKTLEAMPAQRAVLHVLPKVSSAQFSPLVLKMTATTVTRLPTSNLLLFLALGGMKTALGAALLWA